MTAKASFWGLLVSLFLLASCAAIKTATNLPDPKDFGIPYYLPKSLVTVTVAKTTSTTTKKTDYTITAASAMVPDTEHLFTLQPQHNFLASDRICIARTQSGLLASLQFATDDKTDEILVKLAELGAKVLMRAEEDLDVETETVVAIGDPYRPDEILSEIRKKFQEIEEISFPYLPNLAPGTSRSCPEKAVCFSTLISTPVLLRGGNGGVNVNNLAATSVQVVDMAHVGKLMINRPFLAEKVAKFGFKDGVLTSMAVKQPSEGIALATLPLDVLDAIISVPANFLATALGGVFSDQKAVLEQQKQLAELQSAIRAAQPQPSESITETTESFQLQCVSLVEEKKN